MLSKVLNRNIQTDEQERFIRIRKIGKGRSISISFPPFSEQKVIESRVEALMQKIEALENEITQRELHANMLVSRA